MADPDVIAFDVEGVSRLAIALEDASAGLGLDHDRLRGPVLEASFLLGIDRSDPLHQMVRIRAAVDDLATDTGVRLEQVRSTLSEARAIDALTAHLTMRRRENALDLTRLQIARTERIRDLLGVDATTVRAVTALVDEGVPVLEALSRVITARQRMIDDLVESGLGPIDALSVVSITETYDLDLGLARDRAAADGESLLEVLGHMAIAESLGLSIDDAITLGELKSHFETFDSATGGPADGRTSITDHEFVTANPGLFAPSQIRAAQIILASPVLLARLDTAAANDDVLTGTPFGATEAGDGVISIEDLRAFVLKAQLSHALGPYADQMDVAADPGGEADGFISRADLETFLATTPDLPADVRGAANTMLDAGLFDRTWLEEHRDELALGAAVLAGATAAGVVIAVSGGTATPLMLMAGGGLAGGVAGAGTTLVVNATGDAEDALDDVVDNAMRGGLLGGTTAGIPVAFEAVGTAATLPTRLTAAANVISDSATITSVGGIDILLPESVEDEVHDAASFVAGVTGPLAEYEG
jgi:hypothetical protein